MIFFAIPFFKNVAFLQDTLNSLLYQSSSNWSAVVLDDSIDDLEAKKAERYIKKLSDPRIEYKKNPNNLGMANNWNQGLELGKKNPNAIATSILHADDRLLPEYVESMIRALKNNPDTTAFFCKTVIIDGEGKSTFSFTDFYKNFLLPTKRNGVITLSGIEGIKPLIPGNFIFCPTLCYRNSLLLRGFDPSLKMVTDFELTLDLLLHGHQLKGLYHRPLFAYRRHSANTTNLMNQNLERFKEEKALYLSLAQRLEKKGCLQLAKQARKLKIIKKNLLFLMITSLIKGKWALMSRYFQFYFQLKS